MPRRTAPAAVLTCLAATPAFAATYDAVAQFHTSRNTNHSLWSYRAAATGSHDGKYARLTHSGTFACINNKGFMITLKDWDTPGGTIPLPRFAANKAGSHDYFVSNDQHVVLPGRTLLLQPDNTVPAVLSFRAPAAGTAMIAYQFTHLDWTCATRGHGIAWSIEKNSGDAALASGQLVSPDAHHIDTTGPQNLSVSVAAGDRINFIVDGVDNPPNCDAAGLAVTITTP